MIGEIKRAAMLICIAALCFVEVDLLTTVNLNGALCTERV